MKLLQSSLNENDQILAQIEFVPPYCPNPNCKFHHGGKNFFCHNGFATTKKIPHVNQRYKCLCCRKQFSFNTFTLDYRKKFPGLFEEIHFNTLNTMSNHSIARKLKIPEGTVRNRIEDLARQSILLEKDLEANLKIKEPVAYDGFESFCNSQFSPCYINTAVGSRSLFTYKTTYSPMNRKGRMTDLQKIKNEQLIKKHGKYPQNSIRKETTNILKDLLDRLDGE